MRFLRCLPVLAALALPQAGGAQVLARQFVVAPRGGYIAFARASSLENAGYIGVDANYGLTNMIAIGATFAAARAQTRGSDFIAGMPFGDTTFLVAVTQPISMVNAGVTATVRLPLAGRIDPFLTGGVGGYTLYLDPQVVGGPQRFSRLSALVGGGVNFQLGSSTGILLDVRDMIFTGYRRHRLDPTASQFQDARYREDLPAPPADKSTLNNIMLSIGFTFRPTPSGTSTPEGGETTP